MEKFKYIENVVDRVGEIRVYDQIGLKVAKNGREIGISGSVFANEMAYLKTVCDKINIRFNSDGGSVIDGYAIFSSILNAGVPTESFIDGVAASTAGWCAMAADKVSIMDYATLMIHGVSGSDDEQLTAMVNSSIAKMICSRSGMSESDANALMQKETWYNASNKGDKKILLENKFVDAIISTDKKVKINKADFSNLSQIYNKIINTETMSKLNKLLNLSNDAEGSEQEKAVEGLQGELAAAKAKLAEVENKLKEKEAAEAARELAEKEALKNEVTAFVNKAEKDGLISKDEVETTIANASKDRATFSFISNLISKAPSSKESKKPFDFKNVTTGKGSEDRSTWSFSDWSKKDEKGLAKMKNESPEQFQELYNKEYKNA